MDGVKTVASHTTAICQREVYVWDGGEDLNRFVHALTAIRKLSVEQQAQEKMQMKAWMSAPTRDTVPTELPQWRFFAWLELLRYGAIE